MSNELSALIVDDEESIRETLILLLTNELTLKAQTAIDGQDAYRQIKAQRPDILLTDVKMPNMSGDILLERLVTEGIQIPTLVITASEITDQNVRAIYYSHRMYTEEQARRLQLPVQSIIEEQRVYMNRTKAKAVERYGIVTDKKDFGFTVIIKPDITDDVRQRINQLKELLYAKYHPQS